MKQWIRRLGDRALALFRDSLQAGEGPHRMAMAVAIGLFWGTLPMLGPVTAASVLSGWIMRVSVPLIVGVTLLITPLQAILALPFRYVGAWVSPDPMQQLGALAAKAPFLQAAGNWQIQAVLAWLLVMPPLSLAAYFIALRLFRKWQNALSNE
jgi:uncharacterized protein (DUF2062 family)